MVQKINSYFNSSTSVPFWHLHTVVLAATATQILVATARVILLLVHLSLSLSGFSSWDHLNSSPLSLHLAALCVSAIKWAEPFHIIIMASPRTIVASRPPGKHLSKQGTEKTSEKLHFSYFFVLTVHLDLPSHLPMNFTTSKLFAPTDNSLLPEVMTTFRNPAQLWRTWNKQLKYMQTIKMLHKYSLNSQNL